MFAPKVKVQTRDSRATANRSASAGSTRKARPLGSGAAQQADYSPRRSPQETTPGASWDFSKTPIYSGMNSFGEMARTLSLGEDSVRIRSDATSVDFLERNRAVAAAIDPSTILVRPESRGNDVVMSHELIHIAQLRRGVTGSVQQAEHSAEIASRALRRGQVPESIGSAGPAPLFMHLTGGAFDQALDHVGVSDAVIKLLKKSRSFMGIVQALDQHYVWSENPKLHWDDPIANGVLTGGAFAGRRKLFIQGGASEGSFYPYSSPDTKIASDLIKLSTGEGDVETIRSIAHEATHAFHVATGKPPPADVEASIQAGITEEIDTRKSEVAIAKEIYPKRSNESRAIEEQVAAGYLSRPLVERDIAPDIGLSYLESSGFGALLAETQRKDGLSDEQAEAIRNSMDAEKGPKKFPMVGSQHGDEPSSYAFVYVNRKIAMATWRKFGQDFRGREDSPEALKEKERLLQENAHALLDGRIKYSPLALRGAK
jgi:hypothetical protein